MRNSFRNLHCSASNKQSGRTVWYFLFSILAFAAGISLYIFTSDNFLALNTEQANSNQLPGLQHATSFHSNPSAFPSFSLIDHHEKKYTNDNIKNAWSFVFFGFTNCPDICPLTLSTIDQVINKLNSTDKPNSQAVLISVDPRRDTTTQLHEYVRYFNDFTIGLTGDSNEIKQLTQKLGVVYTTPDTETTKDYVVDHSAHIFLVSPDGNLMALFSTPHKVETIVNDFNILNAHYISKHSTQPNTQ